MRETPIRDLFRRKFGMSAGNVIGVGTYTSSYTPVDPETGTSSSITPNWMVGATGVEIDTEIGHLEVLRLVSVADAGKAINPGIVATQLSGSAIMSLGGALLEHMQYVHGELASGSLAYYKIPAMHDVPQVMEGGIVESAQSSGPFGAKGVGESASFSVAPAIANAVEDAVGIRLMSLPHTPEVIYRPQVQAALAPLLGQRQAALFELSALLGRTPSEVPKDASQCRLVAVFAGAIPVGDGAQLLRRRPETA
ncbi:molybdopterin cofactor-binding domain-containing protein [Variovorax sp. RT4R15]|uniref:molybdopterin cofactor-binding domain-containing protein n=1 Tax=Variovorax sp. RT4R15 TaxID=3443737 RepID=UPI003F478A31